MNLVEETFGGDLALGPAAGTNTGTNKKHTGNTTPPVPPDPPPPRVCGAPSLSYQLVDCFKAPPPSLLSIRTSCMNRSILWMPPTTPTPHV